MGTNLQPVRPTVAGQSLEKLWRPRATSMWRQWQRACTTTVSEPLGTLQGQPAYANQTINNYYLCVGIPCVCIYIYIYMCVYRFI